MWFGWNAQLNMKYEIENHTVVSHAIAASGNFCNWSDISAAKPATLPRPLTAYLDCNIKIPISPGRQLCDTRSSCHNTDNLSATVRVPTRQLNKKSSM